MAKALDSSELVSSSSSQVYSLRSIVTLRVISGIIIILGSITTLIGVSWDVQWHDFIGRDRTLIPPHIMMLTGIFVGGLVAMATVLLETGWARRNTRLASHSTAFAGFFSSSLGTYIAGFTALCAAIAFPLDAYWHALYGIDVQIWAPFHLMILVGS